MAFGNILVFPKLICSKNVNIDIAYQLSMGLNIKLLNNLERYLNVPLLLEKVAMQTYEYIIDKVKS